ncbi:MAG TPA: winged helix-turn-helix domain-containing protein [Nitrososphaeraceae archaeon]
MKLRCRTDIIANILSSINSRGSAGASKSHIVEIADISYMKLKHYEPLLTRCGLTDLEDDTNLYFVTPKGQKYLELYQSISELEEVIPLKAMLTIK